MKKYGLCLALFLLACDKRPPLQIEPAVTTPPSTTPPAAAPVSTGKLPILGDPLGLLSRPPTPEPLEAHAPAPKRTLGPGALMASPSERTSPSEAAERDPRAVERSHEVSTRRMPIASAEVHEDTAAGVFRELQRSSAKLRVLYLYASYCPACREVMPNVRAFAKQYYGRGVEFTAASVDRDRDAYAVYAASALEGVFPAKLITSDGSTARELNRLGVPTDGKSFSIPLVAVLDRNNRVVSYGHTNMAGDLARTIDPLLKD